jgi:hypothetical protein
VVETDLADVIGAFEQAAEKREFVGDVARNRERVKAKRNADAFTAAKLRLPQLEPRGQLGDDYRDDTGVCGGIEYRRRIIEAIEVASMSEVETEL